MIRLDVVIFGMALAVSLAGFIPLFPWLETFPKLFLPGAVLFGLLAERRRFTLSSRLVTAGSVAVFLIYLLRVSRTDLVGPIVNLLVVLLGVRFLGERSARNYLQIFLLALFCLAASSLYSLDALFMVYLGLQVVLFEIALVLLACYDRDPACRLPRSRMRSLLAIPVGMLALSLPLLLAFFMILPRTQFPLWEFLANAAGKKTGFSETVQPGSSATLGETSGVVFRAECARLAQEELYWRAITLSRFDGRGWSRGMPRASERFAPGKGRKVSQRIFLEPGTAQYLVALDAPVQVSGVRGLVMAPDYTLTRPDPAGRRCTYDAVSIDAGMLRGSLGADRGFYLKTPDRMHAWLREQGKTLRASGTTDAERLAAVEALFRKQRLKYSVTGLSVADEPLVDFLTVNRTGNCEFFASSCALLLRLAGVPARLVGGFLGGEYNQVGNYYVVTEARAHVWVEAYLEGHGWVRLDPSRWAVNGGEIGASSRPGTLRSLLLAADTIAYFWNRQIIAYDLEQQISLFNEASRRLQWHGAPQPGRLATFLGLTAAALLVIWGGLKVLRRPPPEARLVELFLARLHDLYNVDIRPEAGLTELTDGITDPDVIRFVAIHGRAVYRDKPLTREEVAELHAIIKRMQKG